MPSAVVVAPMSSAPSGIPPRMYARIPTRRVEVERVLRVVVKGDELPDSEGSVAELLGAARRPFTTAMR